MDKLLTLAVATYNMEKYLDRCLSSLLIDNKDLLQRLEVLVINDGSKDSSLSIAQRYAEQYPGVFYAIDKENGNYGSCINKALELANGKYFRPLDADDWFDTKELERFLAKLDNCNADMVYTHFTVVRQDADNERSEGICRIEYEHVYTQDEFTELDVDVAMHAVTYKLNVLRKAHLRLDEGIYYTDTEYVFLPIGFVESFICFNINLYQYYVGREGQSMENIRIGDQLINVLRITENMIRLKNEGKSGGLYGNPYLFNRVFLYYLKGYYNKHLECQMKKLDALINIYDSKAYHKRYKIYRGNDFLILMWRKLHEKYFKFQCLFLSYYNIYLVIRNFLKNRKKTRNC